MGIEMKISSEYGDFDPVWDILPNGWPRWEAVQVEEIEE